MEFAGLRSELEVLSSLRRPWFVVGGWALDLFLGRETRSHKDIDIAIFREDQRETLFASYAVPSIMLIAGIVVASRAKQVPLRAGGVVGAIVGFSLLCLLTLVLLIGIVTKAGSPANNVSENFRLVSAKDNSCEISIPGSWVENL
jgi:Aminoglycoside-2''-adenylyltransferase